MPQPEQPQGLPESVVLKHFDGYKNTLKRERLGQNDLAKAINIDLDDDGQPHRRRGRQQRSTIPTHSLWNTNDGTVLCVQAGVLGVLRPDFSFVSLGVDVGGDYSAGSDSVAFCQVGDDVYFSAFDTTGIINLRLGSVRPWGPAQDIWLSPVVNPTTNLPAIRGKLLGAPPLARYLAYYNGRIYLAVGRVVWATELWTYGYVDKTRTFFPMPGEITMLGNVTDGLMVGTDEGVYYLGGAELSQLRQQRVMDNPVIPGSMAYIPQELANPPQVGIDPVTPMSVSIAFMTTKGFCVASDGGKTINLTEARVFFPVAKRAAAFFRRQDGMNHYVAVMDSEGGPTNGARFGDFVDAEIIRGNVQWVDVNETITMLENANGF